MIRRINSAVAIQHLDEAIKSIKEPMVNQSQNYGEKYDISSN